MGGAKIFAVWGQRAWGRGKGIGAETGHMSLASSYLGATAMGTGPRAQGAADPAPSR